MDIGSNTYKDDQVGKSFHSTWLVDWWVIKIKKSLRSFAHAVCRDQMNRARNADHAAGTHERFAYSRVKIVWLSNMADTFLWEIHEVRKGMWVFFLGCAFGCWLAEQTNSDHMDHVIGVFDLLDLWVIKIKRPMILCARSTSRSNISNMEDTFVEKCTRCAKVCGLFLIDCWLAEQKNCDNLEVIKRSEQTFENRLCYLSSLRFLLIKLFSIFYKDKTLFLGFAQFRCYFKNIKKLQVYLFFQL